MSKSRKRHPIKRDNMMTSSEYWRPIRREWKSKLNFKNVDVTFLFEDDFLKNLELRLPKEIVNDYAYCDWINRWEVCDEHIKYPERKAGEYWGVTYEDVEIAKRK